MNKIAINGVCIAICLVFVSVLINSSHAQSADKFLTYTNNDLKFSIQYPSNWKIQEIPAQGVYFRPPVAEHSVEWLNFDVDILSSPEPYLDTDTMTLKTPFPEEVIKQELSAVFSDRKIIKQNEITVGGNKAWKTEYTTNDVYGFNIYTHGAETIYKLSFRDELLKVPETISIANKMVESFQVGVN